MGKSSESFVIHNWKWLEINMLWVEGLGSCGDVLDDALDSAAATVEVNTLALSLIAGSIACLCSSSCTEGWTVLMCLKRLFVEPALYEMLISLYRLRRRPYTLRPCCQYYWNDSKYCCVSCCHIFSATFSNEVASNKESDPVIHIIGQALRDILFVDHTSMDIRRWIKPGLERNPASSSLSLSILIVFQKLDMILSRLKRLFKYKNTFQWSMLGRKMWLVIFHITFFTLI